MSDKLEGSTDIPQAAPGQVLHGMAEATRARYDKPQPYRGFIARFPRAILAVTGVSEYGTKKHEVPLDDVSFVHLPEAEHMFAEAECRHLLHEAIEGSLNANDNDLFHKAQKAWNAMADLEVFLIQMSEEMAMALATTDELDDDDGPNSRFEQAMETEGPQEYMRQAGEIMAKIPYKPLEHLRREPTDEVDPAGDLSREGLGRP